MLETVQLSVTENLKAVWKFASVLRKYKLPKCRAYYTPIRNEYISVTVSYISYFVSLFNGFMQLTDTISDVKPASKRLCSVYLDASHLKRSKDFK